MTVRRTGRRAAASWTLTLVLMLLALALGMWAGRPGNEHAGEGRAMAGGKGAESSTIWTCSMHPQIRLEEPGKCPLCGMDLIPLEDDGDETLDPSMLSMSEAAKTLARVATLPVERRRVQARIRMVGKVAYDETRVEEITARFPGRLDRLYVDYTGVPVRDGDHLASIYSPELLSAQQELLQAIKATEEMGDSDVRFMREATRQTVQATREKLRLLGLTPAQLEWIEKTGEPSDHVALYAHQSGIVVEKHAMEGAYVSVGTKIYTIVDLSRVWVNLEAYESDLAWIRYGQEVEFETEAYPGEIFEGRISFVHPVLDERTRTVKLRVNVENAAGRLKPGMFVRSTVRADLVGDGKIYDRELAGKWISPMHPEVVKDGPGKCDVCGMPLVRAETLGYVGSTDADELPLVVPESAPLRTGTRAVVYVEVPGRDRPTYEARVVRLGARTGDHFIVLEGLEEGEQVVVQGNFKIDSAVQIKAGPSMMSLPSESELEEADLRRTYFFHQAEELGDELAELGRLLVVEEDGDAASERFTALSESVARLPLDDLEGASLDRAQKIREQLSEAAVLGMEAWELAEMRGAFLQAGRALQRLAPAEAPGGPSAGRTAELVEQLRGLSFALAERLAADDLEGAQRAVEDSELPSTLREAGDGALFSSFAFERWVLLAILEGIREAPDLSGVREQFTLFSDEVVALSDHHPDLLEGGRHLGCPMAFGGRGATWIQRDGPVENPYFGAAMLRCGEPAGASAGR